FERGGNTEQVEVTFGHLQYALAVAPRVRTQSGLPACRGIGGHDQGLNLRKLRIDTIWRQPPYNVKSNGDSLRFEPEHVQPEWLYPRSWTHDPIVDTRTRPRYRRDGCARRARQRPRSGGTCGKLG